MPTLTGAAAAVAEMDGDAVVRVAGHGEDGAADRAATIVQRHDVADDLAVLAALHRRTTADIQPFGRRRAHEDGVVPGELRDRLGQLLQPAVVRETAVEHGGIVTERDLHRAGVSMAPRGDRGTTDRAGCSVDRSRREGRVGHDAVVQPAAPSAFELRCGVRSGAVAARPADRFDPGVAVHPVLAAPGRGPTAPGDRSAPQEPRAPMWPP